MSDHGRRVVQDLVTEEIERVIADAGTAHRLVPMGRVAEELARAYPNSGRTTEEWAEEVLKAAIDARVPVEIGRPGKPTTR